MKILIVVDVQNDFIDGVLGTEEAVKIIPHIKEKIENFAGEILYTMDTHDKNYLNTQEGRNLPVKHCIEGSYGWQIRAGIYKDEAKIFKKFHFVSLDLVDYIKTLNVEDIESIEFIGICTDICVIANAMMIKGHFPEIKLIVDSRCCAGVTPESHRKALEVMKMCQININ